MIQHDVPVSTALPASQWRHLAGLAEQNGTTVASLVREIVRRQFAAGTFGEPAPRPAPPPPARQLHRMGRFEHDRIRELNAAGWNDTQIADEISFDNSTVSAWRKAAGLPKRTRAGAKGTTTEGHAT